MIQFSKSSIWRGLIMVCLLAVSNRVVSQSAPFGAQFFENQFISNPAWAGISTGLNVNMNYRNQWRVMAGTPVSQAVTGDYRLTARGQENVGVGLLIFNEKAGLIGRTRVTGTYAYHLVLNDVKQAIHFGLSLGLMSDRLDESSLDAIDPDDQLVSKFNSRRSYIDGDFGLAYTTERLSLQGSLPNLKTMLKKDSSNTVGNPIAFASCSYKIGGALDVFTIEPKLSILSSTRTGSTIGVGTNLTTNNRLLSFTGIYMSNGGSMIGLGLTYDKMSINGYYTSRDKAMGGDFELNLRIYFPKKQSIHNKGD
jgi:type IX secretion system PorP/SprF family membrane protein